MHGGLVIELDRLIACALGGDDDGVEEHVLACTPCAELFASFVRLGPALAATIRAGDLGFIATRSLVDRLDRESMISRRYRLTPGVIVPCTIGLTDILSMLELEADLTSASRVDLARGAERLADIPFDRTAGRIYVITPAAIVRRFPTMKIPFRLLAVDGTAERTLGDYTLDHTAP
jgi:hypothetical protein